MYMAMLTYRSTSLDNGLSPAELLMGHKLCPSNITPKLINPSQLHMKESQHLWKPHSIPFFQQFGNHCLMIFVKMFSLFLSLGKRATVVKQKGIHSYLVRMEDGSVYQRNRKHLNWLPRNVDEEVPPSQPPEVISILPLQNSPSDFTPMTYQTRSGRTVRAPLRYCDSGLT